MKKNDFIFAGSLAIVFFIGLFLLLSQQETDGKRKPEPAPTATPEPTEAPDNIDIIFVDGIPTAVLRDTTPTATNTPTPEPTATSTPTPTDTPTPTNTPTKAPTATRKPTERPNTPTTTKAPTPTKKPLTGDLSEQSTWKPYERYWKINKKSSPQYKLQQIAYTGDYGIRMVDGRYCVALGSGWATEIGTKLDIYMDTGQVIHAILGDCKRDEHCDPSHRIAQEKREVIEFIVDETKIPDKVKGCGNFDCLFPGRVVKMEIVGGAE